MTNGNDPRALRPRCPEEADALERAEAYDEPMTDADALRIVVAEARYHAETWQVKRACSIVADLVDDLEKGGQAA